MHYTLENKCFFMALMAPCRTVNIIKHFHCTGSL